MATFSSALCFCSQPHPHPHRLSYHSILTLPLYLAVYPIFDSFLVTFNVDIAAIEKLSVEVEQVLVTYFSEQVEKLSSDYFSDWAEAVYFVFSSGLCKLTNPLCCVTLDGFRRVLKVSKPSAGAGAGAAACLINAAGEVIDKMAEIEVARDNGEEGFAGMGKALTLTRAAMTGEINACALRNAPVGSPLSSSPLCALLAHILSEQESNFFSPFRNCRLEIGKIFSLLSESGCSDSLDLSAILSKIANAVNAGAGVPADDDISQNVANVVIGELVSIASSLSPFTADKDKSSGVTVPSATVAASKSAIETACAWAQFMSQTLPSWRSTDCLPKRAGGHGFGGLLSIVLCGSGHADFELAKLSHEVCIRSLQGIRGDMRTSGVRVAGDILSIAVDVIVSQKDHPSFHVRETVMLCGFVLTAKNSYCLSESELKALKNLFIDGLHDVKPEGKYHTLILFHILSFCLPFTFTYSLFYPSVLFLSLLFTLPLLYTIITILFLFLPSTCSSKSFTIP